MINTPSSSSDNSHKPHIPHISEREDSEQSSQKPHPEVSPAEIKYRFALNDSGQTVDVLSLKDRERCAGQSFRCLSCDEPMMARLGSQLAHHFAHKSNSQCSGETYLHHLAKKVFQEEFEHCLATKKPFWIELPQRQSCNHHGSQSAIICKTPMRLRCYNLVPHVCAIRVEKKAQAFVPDITLVSQNGKDDIWVEFAVTHHCSAAKLRAKHRIVEITINNEADVEILRQHTLSSLDNRVRFIHFKDTVLTDMCLWYNRCQLAKRVLIVYPNGKLDIEYLGKDEDLLEAKRQAAIWNTEEYVHRGDVPATPADYNFLLNEAAQRSIEAVREAGHIIRSCGLCKHYDRNRDASCTKHGSRVLCQQALECKDFSLAEDMLPDEEDE